MPLRPLNLYIFNSSSLQKWYIAAHPVIFMLALCDLGLILFAVLGVDVSSRIQWCVPVMMSVKSVFLFYMEIKMWVNVPATVTSQSLIRIGLAFQFVIDVERPSKTLFRIV